MPLSMRAKAQVYDFNFGLSYRPYDRKRSMRDALNVFTNQGRLETRHGISKFNSTALAASVQSISFFEKSDGTTYIIAKAGTILYSVAASGASTELLTGLASTTKHNAVTFGERHIIAIGSDNMYSFDGTTATQLGQAPPSSFTDAIAAGGSLVDANVYQAAITYYSSTYGFESNAQEGSLITTANPNKQINLSDIPATAANAFIDKVRIYVKDVTAGGDFLFIAEINLGTTTYSIDDVSTSGQTPPTTHAAPQSGGGQYLSEFNERLVYGGSSSFLNDVFFSEQDGLPDAFDDTSTAKTLNIPGNGKVTGLGQGFFNDSQLDPYLVIFKRKSIHIYSEVGGVAKFTTISNEIGCVSHDTINEIDGNVYFLSDSGWRVVVNGRILKDSKAKRGTLSEGDIDDIFTSNGFTYEINKSYASNFQSVYYPTLNQYLTLVAEGSNNSLTKIYSYEVEIDRFKPYQFAINPTAMSLGEDASGNECVLLGDSSGFIYTHGTSESRTDITADDTSTDIAAFFLMNWHPQEGDFDATYNFRELMLRAITGNNLTVKAWTNFDQATVTEYTYSFPDPNSGFILDVSQLDIDTFTDGRAIVHARGDVNLVGKVLLLGFYQENTDSNINLLSLQLDYSKNGNSNT